MKTLIETIPVASDSLCSVDIDISSALPTRINSVKSNLGQVYWSASRTKILHTIVATLGQLVVRNASCGADDPFVLRTKSGEVLFLVDQQRPGLASKIYDDKNKNDVDAYYSQIFSEAAGQKSRIWAYMKPQKFKDAYSVSWVPITDVEIRFWVDNKQVTDMKVVQEIVEQIVQLYPEWRKSLI